MSSRENIKIFAFVGLVGSGKSTAVHHLAELKYPKITAESDDETINEALRLVDAGQHALVIDEMHTVQGLRQLKHTFPGAVTLVAVFAEPEVREHRMHQTDHQVTTSDWESVEQGESGDLIALADTVILNNGSLEEFYAEVERIVKPA